jgi:hypothetical protein
MKPISMLATFALLWLCGAVSRPSPPPIEPPQVAAKPGPATHMLYDTHRRQVVLLTASKQAEREAVWGWDGRQWAPIPGAGPEARELGGAAYDAARNRIVLYGGIGLKSGQDRKGDTWEWDETNWRQMTDTSVGTRDHHAMAYDAARSKTVLFGGQPLDRSWVTDTWEWDGMKWARITTPGPGGRVHFPMIHDSKRRQVVLFAGLGEDYKAYNDTWAWDGKTWQKLSEEGPPRRTHHAMAFDSRAGVIVLYGGRTEGGDSLDDTWIWDGPQWREIKTAGPGKRNSHVMAYDAARDKTVLYGGSSYDGRVATKYDDTWEWDGKQWQQVSP